MIFLSYSQILIFQGIGIGDLKFFFSKLCQNERLMKRVKENFKSRMPKCLFFEYNISIVLFNNNYHVEINF